MRVCLIALVVAVFAAGAAAVPALVITQGTAPDGKDQYLLSLDAPAAESWAYGATLTFTPQAGGAIQQVLYGILSIKLEADATAADGSLGYSKGNDSWVATPFVALTVEGGIDETLPNYSLAIGTPSGQTYNDLNLLQIVCTGNVDYSGTWAYGVTRENATDVNVSGTVPEPMTLCLLGAGGLALLRRRR